MCSLESRLTPACSRSSRVDEGQSKGALRAPARLDREAPFSAELSQLNIPQPSIHAPAVFDVAFEQYPMAFDCREREKTTKALEL
jgi:hypothetical protein